MIINILITSGIMLAAFVIIIAFVLWPYLLGIFMLGIIFMMIYCIVEDERKIRARRSRR